MSDQPKLVRATLFVAAVSERGEAEYRWVREWFARWGDRVRIERDDGSDPDYYWDVEGPAEAVAEIPEELTCLSEWSRRPYPAARERKARRHGRR
jgi:hypothetical protein